MVNCGDQTMPAALIECSFLIPLRRDGVLSDGASHEQMAWDWLNEEAFNQFGGLTQSHALYEGSYIDPDSHQQISDISRRFFVAIEETRLDALRTLLRGACVMFAQKCIYLSIAGRVEFIEVDQ